MENSKKRASFAERMKAKVAKMKKNLIALYYAYKNPETPLIAKLLIGITIGYLLSPIDLIPDFIPVLGLLDDLLIVPLLIIASIRLIPKQVWKLSLERAIKEPVILNKSKWFVVIIVLIWLLLIVGLILYLKNNTIKIFNSYVQHTSLSG